MMRWLVGFVVLLGLLACAPVETEPAAPQTGAYLGAVEPGQLPALYVPGPVAKNEAGEAALLPPPIPRTRVRMHMDQLESSLTSVLGGLEWVDKGGKSKWAPHYSALGVPDYMNSVREIIGPSLLFDKLLGDAARDLCPQLLTQEKDLPMEERVFLTQVELTDTLTTSPDLVEANLSLLLLRFHGRHIPVGDERLMPWKTLFGNTVSLSESTETAWTAVCVALLIHPEFSSR
jgi:hypothetical protein